MEPEVTGAEEELEKATEAPVTKKERTATQEKEELERIKQEAVTPQVVSALNKLGIDSAKDNHVFSNEAAKVEAEQKPEPERPSGRRKFLLKSPSEYLPMIRRGFNRGGPNGGEEQKEDQVISVGWKVEVRNRKEREELLRYVCSGCH